MIDFGRNTVLYACHVLETQKLIRLIGVLAGVVVYMLTLSMADALFFFSTREIKKEKKRRDLTVTFNQIEICHPRPPDQKLRPYVR